MSSSSNLEQLGYRELFSLCAGFGRAISEEPSSSHARFMVQFLSTIFITPEDLYLRVMTEFRNRAEGKPSLIELNGEGSDDEGDPIDFIGLAVFASMLWAVVQSDADSRWATSTTVSAGRHS